MEKSKKSSRRVFLKNSTALGALTTIGASHLVQSSSKTTASINMPPILDVAPEGQPLKAGIVGCGGRGTGAAINFLNAGPNLSIHAVADVFQDKIDGIRNRLKVENIELDNANCFVGFDAYKRLLETDVDIVILTTPPFFRPELFQASVEARKHVFMEKPVAVDPVGVRTIMTASKQAEAAGLCVVTGTQRRHSPDYIDIYSRVKGGIIGDLVSANVYWNQPMSSYWKPKPNWTEMESMIRNWVNWTWLSGDHIVEQHIHNIDVLNWFTGKTPIEAVGMGSRQRRITGDQYDNFSVDFVYENQVHMHSICRQINDCSNEIKEYVRGTKGFTNCQNTIWNPEEKIMYEYVYPVDGNGKKIVKNGFDQEHVDLVAAIRNGNQIIQAEETAKSTLTAIMGRIAAYTGEKISWDEMMSSDMKLGPKEIKWGPVDIEVNIPKPGSA